MITSKEEQMRQHIERWKQSGQTKKDYCKDRQLGYSQFKNWCDKFGYVKRRQSKTVSDFISLQPELNTPVSISPPLIEIAYPNGVRLSVPSNTPLNILRALVQIN